jgi:glutathionylspermidine synthase
MYLEEDLDRAYIIDRKERTKQNLAWIKREEFRDVYESLINMYLDIATTHVFNDDIFSNEIPDWVLDAVESSLQNEITFKVENKPIC